MNITLDGFIAGPNCELDWHFSYWNEDMSKTACEELQKADTILFGRKTYLGMSAYWKTVYANHMVPREDLAFLEMVSNHRKIVFSRTLAKAEWNNSRLVSTDAVNELKRLKARPGKNMIVYGSGNFVSSLMQNGIVDEYRLWIHPVFLKTGKPFYNGDQHSDSLLLLETQTFLSGVVLLSYESNRY